MAQNQDDDVKNKGNLINSGRRGLMQGAGLGAALSLLGGTSGLISSAQAAEAAFPQHKKWKIVFVNHVTTNPFFVPTQYGIQDACSLFGMNYQWTGSATSDAGEMVRAVNSAIAAKADAIAVPIVDPNAFDKPIQAALDAGIPVFAYNADAPRGKSNPRLAYIGQDLYLSGYQMGERIASLIDSGLVALFIATPGQLNIQPRLDGASDAIKKSGKKIDVQTVATSATVNEELSKIKSFYLGHQDLKGMFAVDGQHARRRASDEGIEPAFEGRAWRWLRSVAADHPAHPRGLPRFHHRSAAVRAGLLYRDGSIHVPGIGQTCGAGEYQHGAEVRDEVDRRAVPQYVDAL